MLLVHFFIRGPIWGPVGSHFGPSWGQYRLQKPSKKTSQTSPRGLFASPNGFQERIQRITEKKCRKQHSNHTLVKNTFLLGYLVTFNHNLLPSLTSPRGIVESQNRFVGNFRLPCMQLPLITYFLYWGTGVVNIEV